MHERLPNLIAKGLSIAFIAPSIPQDMLILIPLAAGVNQIAK
jgi:hypothetical protein